MGECSIEARFSHNYVKKGKLGQLDYSVGPRVVPLRKNTRSTVHGPYRPGLIAACWKCEATHTAQAWLWAPGATKAAATDFAAGVGGAGNTKPPSTPAQSYMDAALSISGHATHTGDPYATILWRSPSQRNQARPAEGG